MTALPIARREDAIRAVASNFIEEDHLPFWSDDEFLHGQVSLIVAIFGTDENDTSGERSAVHREIAEQWQRMKLEQEANQYANDVVLNADGDYPGLQQVWELVKQAYLVGILKGMNP